MGLVGMVAWGEYVVGGGREGCIIGFGSEGVCGILVIW